MYMYIATFETKVLRALSLYLILTPSLPLPLSLLFSFSVLFRYSSAPFSHYSDPSAVATRVHYTCVMHREAKRKGEDRISSTSPPALFFRHRYRPHTFSFGLSAQKKRRKWRRKKGTDVEEVQGDVEKLREKVRNSNGDGQVSASVLRGSLNKDVLLSCDNHQTLLGH